MKKANKLYIGTAGFLIGGTIGSALTFLFTPKSGRELRHDIQAGYNDYKTKAVNGINEYTNIAVESGKKILDEAAKNFDDVLRKADQLRSLTGNYITGAYSGPRERIETEIISLKRALRAAIDAYKQSPERTKPKDRVVNNIYSEFDDETLPKFEGMGRRES